MQNKTMTFSPANSTYKVIRKQHPKSGFPCDGVLLTLESTYDIEPDNCFDYMTPNETIRYFEINLSSGAHLFQIGDLFDVSINFKRSNQELK